MSAFGTKQTFHVAAPMSGLEGKADIHAAAHKARLVPKADILTHNGKAPR